MNNVDTIKIDSFCNLLNNVLTIVKKCLLGHGITWALSWTGNLPIPKKKNLQGSFFIIYEKLKNRLFHKLWKNCLADFFFYFARMFFGS